MNKLINLGKGKLIEGLGGAYYLASKDWKPMPGNFWQDANLGEGTLYFKPNLQARERGK